MWIAYHRLFDRTFGRSFAGGSLPRRVSAGRARFLRMKEKLRELAEYAKANHIRIILAMTPDIHNLVDYKLGFVHDIMRQIAVEDGYTYVDLLPALLGRPPQESLPCQETRIQTGSVTSAHGTSYFPGYHASQRGLEPPATLKKTTPRPEDVI